MIIFVLRCGRFSYFLIKIHRNFQKSIEKIVICIFSLFLFELRSLPHFMVPSNDVDGSFQSSASGILSMLNSLHSL